MRSNAILNTSIAVTVIAILTVLAGLLSSVFFNISLNSPLYYGIVFLLAVASVMLAVFQIWYPSVVRRRLKPGQPSQIHPLLADAYLKTEETRAIFDSVASKMVELPLLQRQALVKLLEQEFGSDIGNKDNYPVKVTMEVKGTPITIESPDVRKIEEIMQEISEGARQGLRRTQSDNIQQGIVREDIGTYQINDTTAQTEP